MLYLIKTNIPFILVFLIATILGCQKQKEKQSDSVLTVSVEDSALTGFTPVHPIKVPTITSGLNETTNTEPHKNQLKQRMLQENYVEALQLMPHVTEEILARAKGKSEEEPELLFHLRGIYCYLFLMLDQDEDAYKIIKEMPIEPPGNVPAYLISMNNILVLLRLNKVDEIVGEANKILSIPDIPFMIEHAATDTLIVAYLINNDNDSAKETINLWKKLLLSAQFDEDVKFNHIRTLFLYEYYIEHQLQNEYYLSFRVIKPAPPSVHPLNNEEIVYGYGYYGADIISRKDGSVLDTSPFFDSLKENIDSFMKSSQKVVPLPDPFPVLQNNDEQNSIE